MSRKLVPLLLAISMVAIGLQFYSAPADEVPSAQIQSTSGRGLGVSMVTDPVGSVLSGNSTLMVDWQITEGTPPYTVTLEYSNDSGLSYPFVIDSGPLVSPYAWVLPQMDSQNVSVRVTVEDADFDLIYIDSGVFEIDSTRPELTGHGVGFPLVNLTYYFSEPMNHSSVLDAIIIEGPGAPYWTDPVWIGNDLQVTVHVFDTGQYYYNMSDTALDASVPGNKLVPDSGLEFGSTGANYPPYLEMTGPSGIVDDWAHLEWAASDVDGDSMTITVGWDNDLERDVLSGATTVPNTGSFDYDTSAFPPGVYYFWVEADDGNFAPLDYSPAVTIDHTGVVPRTFSVDVDSQGTLRSGGSDVTVNWSGTGWTEPLSVDLEYSTDGGATYPNTISSETNVVGMLDWTLPLVDSALVRIRATITDDDSMQGSDETSVFGIDSSPPTVIQFMPSEPLPGNGDTIGVVFSEPMDDTSAVAAVSIDGPGLPFVFPRTWVGDTLVMELGQVFPAATYWLNVSAGARDASDPGNVMTETGSFSWTFPASNHPPNLTLQQPTDDAVIDNSLSVSWVVEDTEGSPVTVTLGWDDDNDSAQRSTITTLTGSGSYDWDTSLIPDGDYYFWVQISDGEFSPETYVPIRIQHAVAPDEIQSSSSSGSLSPVVVGGIALGSFLVIALLGLRLSIVIGSRGRRKGDKRDVFAPTRLQVSGERTLLGPDETERLFEVHPEANILQRDFSQDAPEPTQLFDYDGDFDPAPEPTQLFDYDGSDY